MDAEQLQLLSQISSYRLVRSLWKLEKRLNHPKALVVSGTESQDKEEYFVRNGWRTWQKLKLFSRTRARRNFEICFSLSLSGSVTSEFGKMILRCVRQHRSMYTSDTNNTVSLTRITVHENSSKDQHSNANARIQARRDWYYDRTVWRSDLTNCCVTESQLYFAMHRFQHDVRIGSQSVMCYLTWIVVTSFEVQN